MAARKHRNADVAVEQAPNRPNLRLADAGDLASTSRVAALQMMLEQEFAESTQTRRLAPAVGISIAVVVSAGLWCAIIAGVTAIL